MTINNAQSNSAFGEVVVRMHVQLCEFDCYVVLSWRYGSGFTCQLSAQECAILGTTAAETKPRFGRQDGMSGSVMQLTALKDHHCSVELDAECPSSYSPVGTRHQLNTLILLVLVGFKHS